MRYLSVLFILSTVLFAQGNPDGEKISIHLTPSVNTGMVFQDIHLNRMTETFEHKVIGTLNFSAIMKVPISDGITISPSVEYSNLKFMNYDMRFTKIGATFSFYLK